MRRREFITLGGAAAAWPLAARAQHESMPIVGFLSFLSRAKSTDRLHAFERGLGDEGYVDEKNVAIDFQSANGRYEQIAGIITDFVRGRVDVIVVNTNAAALAAKAATTDIPIVFYIGSDPVQLGLVESLNRPGGNLTGVFIVTATEVEQKRLELLHQAVPGAKKVAILVNPASPTSAGLLKDHLAAAKALDLEISFLYAKSEADLDAAFAEYKSSQARALLISPDLSFFGLSKKIAALAAHDSVPAISQWREFVLAGGLMSYGSSFTDSFRQIGVYTGRLLRGEKPISLPIQQTTKVDLVVNLKAAKALGIDLPMTLLGRADEVIE